MPTPSNPTRLPTDLLTRLSSSDPETQLLALREIKNQIIGNRTKKLSFLKLGAVPIVASILQAQADDVTLRNNILVQSAAALGSFACGFDPGVLAVLEAGAFNRLLQLLSNPYPKVVDAAARALRMIYISKLAPKFELFKEKNMEFLVSLLNSESENVTGLGACVITHSCETVAEQKALCDAGVLMKLIALLEGSLSQRDAGLEALGAVFRNNPEVVSKFVGIENGKALSLVVELTKDRFARTQLLACMCLIVIRNTSASYVQEIGIVIKLVNLLIELLDDPGQVGDEAPFVFSNLIAEKEDLQKLAFEAKAIDRFHNCLQKVQLSPKRLQGVLLALADLCSQLECCRSKFLSLKVQNFVIDALTHDSADVRIAACVCIRSVTRSIKNLCAGYFMNEMFVIPLLQLLDNSLVSVQVAALGAISNILVDFATRKSTFVKCGGVKQLVRLSKSMDSTVRSNALCSLKNMVFLADDKCKEGIFQELTPSLIATLICDSEPCVQEQALALVRNFVDGCINSVEYVLAEDGTILNAVGRQLQSAAKAEVGVQGMYVLGNIASGNELHKEAVMHQLLPEGDNQTHSFITNFLQSGDSGLRTAAVWAVVNLTFPSCPGAFNRLVKLRNAGIVSQIRNMVNDPCLDVKLRVRTMLTQSMTFGDGLT